MASTGDCPDLTVNAEQVLGQQIGDHNSQINIGTQINQLPGRPARHVPRHVRFRLPRVVAGFTARDAELDKVERSWPQDSVQPPVQVITGLPGVGKTQLAAAYTASQVDRFDLVAWLRAVDPVTDLGALADQLGLTEPEDTPEQRAERALGALAVWDQAWLLIFDNVDDPELLARWCPANGPGRVLVTARSRQLTGFGRELHLTVFDLTDATTFLLDGTGRAETERSSATQLALALGRLPLALQHAAAYCSLDRGGPDFTTYLQLLDELPSADLFIREPEAFYQQTVTSTWTTSITAAVQQAPLAADILNMASMLDPDSIPLPLFDVLLSPNDGQQQLDGAQARGATAADAVRRKRLRDGLAVLHSLCLAQLDRQHLAVHRLLQKVIRDQLDQHVDSKPFHGAVVAVAAATPTGVESPASWPLWQTLITHVHALASRTPVDMHRDTAEGLLDLLNASTAFLQWSGRASESLGLAQQAQALGVRWLSRDHPLTLVARSNLAYALRNAGRHSEAITLAEQAVADSERVLGSDHYDTLIARGNLAELYRESGRLAKAITSAEHLLADFERVLGRDHPGTLLARSNLAHCYWSAGRSDEATPLEEQVLADSERVLGSDHPSTLTARGNLAASYATTGRTTEAMDLSQHVLGDSQRLLGPDHPATLLARGNLADLYRSSGRTAEAIATDESVLADSERVLGPEHPATLTARGRLAASYRSAGRTSEAITLAERALADSERLLGPDHPLTRTARKNLAVCSRTA